MARERTIGIRLTDEERAALDARAKDEERSRSDMGRLLILDGLGLRKTPPTCNCPTGMRHHAINCPRHPGELMRPEGNPAPVAASSTRSERAAKRGDGHAYDGGANLKCKVCGVTQARHP